MGEKTEFKEMVTVEKAPGKYRVRRFHPDGKITEAWAKDPFSKTDLVEQFHNAMGRKKQIEVREIDFGEMDVTKKPRAEKDGSATS